MLGSSGRTRPSGTCSRNFGDPALQSSVRDTVVVIPAYQAERTIQPLVRSLRDMGFPVVVVNDASTDATPERARHAGARVLTRSSNGGKGTALREGLALARDEGFDWILTMDADGQHLPSEIPSFLRERDRGGAGLIIGNRMRNPRGMPFDRRVTNRLMSWLISRIVGQEIPDTQCGFRLISRRVLEKVHLTSRRFEVESELVMKSARAGFQIVSVPVASVYRRQISFIRPIRDTFRFARFLWSLRKE